MSTIGHNSLFRALLDFIYTERSVSMNMGTLYPRAAKISSFAESV